MSEQSAVGRLERLARRLNARDADKITGFVSDLKTVRRRAAGGTTVAVLRAVRDDVGLDQGDGAPGGLAPAPGPLGPDRRPRRPGRPGGPAPRARRVSRTGSGSPCAIPASVDGVVLSTIHRVKGREWPHVVLHEVSAGLLPHRLAVDVEEERRVFHVGLTRGSVSVHVVGGDPPSPFLAELSEEWTTRPSGRRRRPGAAAGAPRAASRPTGHRQAGTHAQRSARRGSRGAWPRGRSPCRPRSWSGPGRRCGRGVRSGPPAEHKPPYVYLHDRTLEALATEAPATMAALANVSGIGPGKLESYGDELLALIAAARQRG